MGNLGNSIKQFTEEMEQVATSVARDVKDSAFEAIETNVQTVTGQNPTPQQLQQKKQQEEEQLAKVRKEIEYYKNLGKDIKKAQEERKQKEAQRVQQMQQEEQAKKARKEDNNQTFAPPKGKHDLREDIARTQAERSKGRGVGG